jgi:hypothetical protein
MHTCRSTFLLVPVDGFKGSPEGETEDTRNRLFLEGTLFHERNLRNRFDIPDRNLTVGEGLQMMSIRGKEPNATKISRKGKSVLPT